MRIRERATASAGALAAALSVLALLAAPGVAATPAPGFEQFAGCPSPAENPAVSGCITSTVDGGYFQMGSKKVPIEKPMTLSGGYAESGAFIGFNSKGGLTPAKQKVPGGVVGLTGLTWLLELLGSDALTLYAVTELAGTPQPVPDPKILPIKVHLINPVLGNNCYVGSNSNPIVLKLTTHTTSPPPPNTPISGKEPTLEFDPEKLMLTLKDGVMVDNSFSAPGATGCTLTLFGFIPISINGLVNSQAGLPAPAGTNTTVQNFDAQIVEVGKVYP